MLCAKCHKGKHNARNCRQLRGAHWHSPYEPKKGMAAMVTPAVGVGPSTSAASSQPTASEPSATAAVGLSEAAGDNPESYISLAERSLNNYVSSSFAEATPQATARAAEFPHARESSLSSYDGDDEGRDLVYYRYERPRAGQCSCCPRNRYSP